jgi:hypothetical protein
LRRTTEKVVGNGKAADILPAPMRGDMPTDEMDFEDEMSDDLEDEMPDDLEEDMPDDLFDDEEVDDDEVLLDEEDLDEDEEGEESDSSNEEDEDTEALDDLEAEELEMLTEDEASETIEADEEKQLRDIRRAQISIEASEAGGAGANEFVCTSCFLVKKTSQMANKRKRICLDCAS